MFRFLVKIYRLVYCLYLSCRFWLRLGAYNFDIQSVDVSLTSYGKRVSSVYISIETLFLGEKRPKRVFLALDDGEKLGWFARIVVGRLSKLGVVILIGPRVGPHAKYFAYLSQVWRPGECFVVVDDDVLYGKEVLSSLINAMNVYPDNNICRRAFWMSIADGCIQPYSIWKMCTETRKSPLIFATNVGGVLVCAKFAEILHSLGNSFLLSAPKADDVWFHWVGVRYKIPYYCCVSEFSNPPVIPFTQSEALHLVNNSGGNDNQIAKTYSMEDVRYLMCGE